MEWNRHHDITHGGKIPFSDDIITEHDVVMVVLHHACCGIRCCLLLYLIMLLMHRVHARKLAGANDMIFDTKLPNFSFKFGFTSSKRHTASTACISTGRQPT